MMFVGPRLLLLQTVYFTFAVSSVIERESPSPGDSQYYQTYATYEEENRYLKRRSGQATNTNSCADVRALPADVREELDLSDFYQKYTETYGIPIVTSSKVSDAALQRACYTARFVLADHYSIRNGYYKRNGRFVLLDSSEVITDIPEFSHLDKYYNTRARGLGATPGIPVSLGAEENAQCAGWGEDKWHSQDIVLHEFAHGMHLLGAKYEIKNFQKRLQKAYSSAKRTGLWNNTYAMDTINEYFAEAVGSYFDQNYDTFNGKPNGIKNHVDTRAELEKYDPKLFRLVKKMFPCNNQYIDRCQDKSQARSLSQKLKMNYPECTENPSSTNTGGGTACKCEDNSPYCDSWASSGYCSSYKDYMQTHCKKSCKICSC